MSQREIWGHGTLQSANPKFQRKVNEKRGTA